MVIKLMKGPFAMSEVMEVLLANGKQLQPLVGTFLLNDIEFTVRIKKVQGKKVPTDGELAVMRMTTDTKESA